MVEIVSTILNTKRQLVGFEFKGKEKEFGIGRGESEIRRFYKIENLPNGFDNRQIRVLNKVITEHGSFKLNNCVMKVDTPNGLVKIENDVRAVKRITEGGKNIGFTVQYKDGTTQNLRVEDIQKISLVFKPFNFVVNENENGTVFLSAKPGQGSLNDLPEINLDKKKVNKNTKAERNVKPVENVKKVDGFEFDILGLYDFVSNSNGYIVKLGSETYKKSAESKGNSYDKGFKPSNGYETGFGSLNFPEDKVDVSMGFRRYGSVKDEESGKVYKTYTFSTKKIFNGAEPTMKKLGVVVDESKIAKLESNPSILIDRTEKLHNGKVLAEINLGSIGLMSDERRKRSILSNEQIAKLATDLYGYKLLSKYFSNSGDLMKRLKKEVGADEFARLKGICINSQYSGLSEEELDRIKELGIDIYSGAYKKLWSPYGDEKEVAESKKTVASDPIEIKYIYDGMDYSKVTGRQMVGLALDSENEDRDLPVFVTIRDIEATADNKKKIEKAMDIMSKIAPKIDEINRKLWEHKVAMLLEGGKEFIHTHDKGDWEIDSTSKIKKGLMFVNKKEPRLKLRVLGVDIPQR